MKYKKEQLFGYLRYYADAQPHRYMDNHQIFLIRYGADIKRAKLNVIEMTRYMVQNGWLMGVGENFFKVYFPFRSFILTEKGDKYFRTMSIERGAHYHQTKYFDRDDPKNN